jgi:ComF family protein
MRPDRWAPLPRATLDAAIAIVLAPACVSCNQPLESPLEGVACGACWASIRPLSPPLCLTCGDPLPSWRTFSVELSHCPRCRRLRTLVTRARSAGDYAGALRDVIHAFKYDGRRSLARPLGRLMRDAGAELLEGASCVVPVPLHPWRFIRRGFNQAADLAVALDAPVLHALWRRRRTASQTGLTATGRRRNVGGAFRLSPFLRSRQIDASLRDGVIVLVDDVRTTGATLEECARVLMAAGAREVRALTAARAPLHEGGNGRKR